MQTPSYNIVVVPDKGAAEIQQLNKRRFERIPVPAESSGMSLPMLAEDLSEGVTDPGLPGELQCQTVSGRLAISQLLLLCWIHVEGCTGTANSWCQACVTLPLNAVNTSAYMGCIWSVNRCRSPS